MCALSTLLNNVILLCQTTIACFVFEKSLTVLFMYVQQLEHLSLRVVNWTRQKRKTGQSILLGRGSKLVSHFYGVADVSVDCLAALEIVSPCSSP